MSIANTAAVPPARARSAAVAGIGRKRRPWWILVLLAIAGIAAGGYAYSRKHRAAPAPRYLTARVTRGEITETIRATGTVQPVLQVQVGAQVSGRIATVAVDFNSQVHQGDLLAEIDPTQYRAQVAQVRASLAASRAQLAQNRANLALAERNLTRANELRTGGYNAQVDVDTALAQRDAARAAVGLAQAQIAQTEASLRSAETNLTYTRIYAPVDGTISTRSVDPGQTVAASFQTPTMFVIANDLTHMRVMADVDEANIGKLREGMAATARVDAFPRETFRGLVSQLRIAPTTTNGVVTYATVIAVDNPERKLRPGMTATITVNTQRRDNVFRVPNAALRYRPHPSGNGPQDSHAARPQTPDAPDAGAIFVLRHGQAVRIPVTVGITDGVNTEVDGPGLHDNDEVVLDETDASGAPRSGAPRMRMF